MYLLNKDMDATIQMPDIFFLQKTAPKQPLWNRQRLNRFYVFFFPEKWEESRPQNAQAYMWK